jgi:hypothetical protein
MDNIIQSIICSQFNSTFGRDAALDTNSDRTHAMQVRFSISPNYDLEDGYRNLTILLFGAGSNYIAVYAKMDWNLVSTVGEPVKGETPWVCYGYHDSCWRDSVGNILREFHGRINTIDYLFNGVTGWYKNVALTPGQIAELKAVRDARYEGHAVRKTVSDLEFVTPHEHKLNACVAGSYCTVQGCNYTE